MKMKLYYVVTYSIDHWKHPRDVNYVRGPFATWGDANDHRRDGNEYIVVHTIEVD